MPVGPIGVTAFWRACRRSSGGGWPAAAIGQLVGVQVQRDEGDRGQAGLLDQDLVDERQDRAGTWVEARGGPDGVADEARQRRCLDALAGDVAEEDEMAAVGGRDDVVEVAADVRSQLTRLVARGDGEVRDMREFFRQQAGLQRVRDAFLRGVEAGVLDGGRRSQREVLGELEIVLVEAASAVGGDERDGAEGVLARAHRDDHHRAHADVADRLQLVRVARSPARAARPGSP